MNKKGTKHVWKKVLAVALAVSLALYSGIQLSDHVLRANEGDEAAKNEVKTEQEVTVSDAAQTEGNTGGTGEDAAKQPEKSEELVISDEGSGGGSEEAGGQQAEGQEEQQVAGEEAGGVEESGEEEQAAPEDEEENKEEEEKEEEEEDKDVEPLTVMYDLKVPTNAAFTPDIVGLDGGSETISKEKAQKNYTVRKLSRNLYYTQKDKYSHKISSEFMGWKTEAGDIVQASDVVDLIDGAARFDKNRDKKVKLQATWSGVFNFNADGKNKFVTFSIYKLGRVPTGIDNKSANYIQGIYGSIIKAGDVTQPLMKNFIREDTGRVVINQDSNGIGVDSCDSKIRNMITDPISTYFDSRNGNEAAGYPEFNLTILDFPSDEEVIATVRERIKEGVQLKVNYDGQPITISSSKNFDDFDTDHYFVKWFSVKYQKDAIHVDGMILQKVWRTIEVPQAHDYEYDGEEKTGVASGDFYSLSGKPKATEPGEYKVTVTPQGGYMWPDGTTEPKELTWKITAKVNITYKTSPEGAGALSRTSESMTTKTVKSGSSQLQAYQEEPEGCEASEVDGFVFKGWFKGDTLVTKSAKLTTADILSADEAKGLDRKKNQNYSGTWQYLDTTYTAKYEPYVDITLKADSDKVKYDGKEHEITTFTGLPEDKVFSEAQLSKIRVSAEGTDAGEYEAAFAEGAPGTLTADDGTKYRVSYEKGKLTIEKRKVTLKSASKERVYDGTSLTAGDISEGGDGWADGEGADYDVTGSQLTPGASANAFAYTLREGTKAENYDIEKEEGTLTVTNRTALFQIDVTAKSLQKTYDGKAATAEGFDGLETEIGGKKFTVSGITSKAEGTNVADSISSIPVEGTPVVTDENGNDVTAQFDVRVKKGSLTILPRSVIMTSASDEKEYDGKALKNDKVEVTGDGFAEGEGADFEVTGSITRAGSALNRFSYTLKEGTDAGNYSITESPGTLTVKQREAKYEIKLKANSGSETYDGREHEVSGFEKTEFTVDGNRYEVSGITAKGAGKNAGEYTVSASGTPVVTDAEGEDVSDQFAVSVETGKLTIAPRKLTLKSASDEKEYDGRPLTKASVSVADGSFAPGEGASYDVSGSQLIVGKSENGFAYSLNEGTVASNYDIAQEYGTLEVTARKEKFKLDVTANSASMLYDGTEHSVSGFEKTTFDIDGVSYSVSGITSEAKAVHAADSVKEIAVKGKPVVKDAYGNDVTAQFDVDVKPGSLTVEKRKITLTSADAEKEYDGSALTKDEVLKSGDGFAEGEGVQTKVTGSQLVPGKSANGFEYTLSEKTAEGDYEITKEEGTLTVTDRETPFEITVTAKSLDRMYDGEKAEVKGFTADSFTVNGQKYTVEGLSAGAEGKDVSDSRDIAVSGTAVVKDSEGNDVTSQFDVKTENGHFRISPRSVVLSSASESKVYDGKVLKNDKITAGGDGWAKGEGASFDVSGALTRPGSVVNTFTYKLKDGTKEENYVISEDPGTLTVTSRDAKYEIEMESNSGDKTYNGKEQTVSGFVTDTFTVDDNEYKVSGLDAKAAGTHAGEYTVAISGTPTVTDSEGKDVSSEFSVKTKTGKLTIKPRKVTVTSASGEKEYDGQPLTANKAEVTEGSWAEGEGAQYFFEGAQTLPGESGNVFGFALNEGVLEGDYEVQLKEGKLTVTDRQEPYKLALKANSGSFLYDGEEHSVSGFEQTSFIVNGVTYEVSGLRSEAAGTHAADSAAEIPVEGTAVVKDAEGNDVTAQFDVKAESGSLEIKKRSVELSSASAEKVYDGTELRSEEVTAGGDGFAPGEGAEYSFSGSQLIPGDSPNSFEYVLAKNTQEGDYDISAKEGTLKVTGRSALFQAKITANSLQKTYDGKKAEVSGFDTLTVLANGQEFTISGIRSEAEGTDVSDSRAIPVEGRAVIKDAKGNDVTGQFSLDITEGRIDILPRSVIMTSAGGEKEYDGKALRNGDVAVTGDGFAEGEGASYDVTGSITRPGSIANTFTYKLNDGTKAGNYSISQSSGTLTVKARDAKYSIEMEAKSGEETYDGAAKSVQGFKTRTFTVDGNEYKVSGLTAEGRGTDAGEYEVAVTGTPIVTDGEGEDVTEQFAVSVKPGTLKIAPRKLTLTSASAEKEYDGSALRAEEVETGGDGFAPGEGAVYTVTGAQILKGESENSFTYALNEGTLASNYDITAKNGKLTVKDRESKYQITLKANSGEFRYDGSEHSVSGFEKMEFVRDGVSYEVSGIKSSASGVHVSESVGSIEPEGTAVVKDRAGNDVTDQFDVSVENGSLNILPRNITMTSGSAERAFDGQNVTAPSVTVSGDGFAPGDGASYEFTAANMLIGSYVNAFKYILNNGTQESDYVITTEEGLLRVIPADMSDEDGSGRFSVKAPEDTVYSGRIQHMAPVVTDKAIGRELTEGRDYTLSYTDAIDVGTVTVTVTGQGSYSGKVKTTYRIVPAVLKVKTESASKQYDGKALRAEGSIEGFVSTESAPLTVTGSQTIVGQSANTYKIDWEAKDATAKKSNYTVSESVGTLSVTRNTAGIVLTAPDAQKVYDGEPLKAEGKASCEGLPEGMDYSVKLAGSRTKAGTGESTIESYSITNADGEDVTDFFGGVSTVSGKLIVTKAPLIVSTGSASKIYDGKSLTNDETDIKGLVGEEKIKVEVTGKQKEVGNSDNTFTIDWLMANKDNYELTEVPGTLTVAESDADVVLTAPSAQKVYDGKALEAKDGVTAAGLPEGFTFEASASGSVTDAGSAANKVDDGYIIRDADGEDRTSSFNNITTVDGTLTVTPRPVTVSSASAAAFYTGQPLTAADGSAEGLAEGEEIAVKGAGSITDVGEEENTIEIDWKEVKEGNYAVTKAPGKLVVSANIDEITIKAPSASKTYDGKALTAEEAAKDDPVSVSGLPEGFTCEASLSGSVTDAGTAESVITAYKILTADGKDVTKFFGKVSTEAGTLKVGKAKIKVTTESADKTYDGDPLTAGGKIAGLAEGEEAAFKVTGSRTKVGSEVNTYEIDWSDEKTTAKISNYEVEEDLGTLSVGEYADEITVTTSGGSYVYDGKEHGAEVKVEGLPKGYSVKEAASTATAKDVTEGGDAKAAPGVRATADRLVIENAAGEDVTARLNITYVDDVISITPAVLTVTTQSAGKVYDGEPLTAEGEISGFAEGESAPLVMKGEQTETGDSPNAYEIAWDDPDATAKAGNYIVQESVGTLHVTENNDEITVITTGGTYIYDGKSHGASVEVVNLPKGYNVAEASSSAIAQDATAEPVKATADKLVIRNDAGKDVTKSLNIKYIDGEIIVKPAVLTVRTPDAEKEYDARPLTAEGSIAGLIGDETASLKTTGTITEVGVAPNSCELVWDGTAKEGNYSVDYKAGSLKIVHSTKEITAKTTGGTFTYDGKEHGAKVEVTGVPEGYSVKLAASTASAVNVSGEAVKATADELAIVDANGNDVTDKLRVRYEDGRITIVPKALTVTTDSARKVYDGESLTAGGRVDGLIEDGIARVVTDGSQKKVGSSPNTYHLEWIDEDAAANYEVAEEAIGTLTVTESADQIVIEASNEAFIYDGEEHGVGVTVTDLPAGYTLEKAESTLKVKDVTNGPQEAKADDVVIRNAEGEDVTDKLDILYIDGSIEILPKTLTVSTPDAAKVYDGSPLTAEGSISGFIGSEQAPFRTTGTLTDVGFAENTYAIDWDDASATANEGNYEVEEDLGTLTISAVPVHALRIDYVDDSGKRVAATYREVIEEGAGYGPVVSPEVEGYEPEYASVEGIMPDRDVSVKVRYTPQKEDPSAVSGRSGNGGEGSGGTGATAKNSAPAGVIISDGGDPVIETLTDDTVPLANTGSWALVNLISMILTVIAAIITLFLYFRRKEDEEDEEMDRKRRGGAPSGGDDPSGDGGSEKGSRRRRTTFCIFSLVIAVISLLAFFFTEDMTLTMQMTDKWTILMIVLMIIDLVLLFAKKSKDEDGSEQEPENA